MLFKLVHGGDIYSPRTLNTGARIIDFSANINPLGLPEAVKNAVCENIEFYHSYPDPLCRELRQALAQALAVSEETIFCANGAADAIYRLVMALKPKKALLLAPAFAEYELALQTVACKVEYYHLREDMGFCVCEDIGEYIQNGVDMVFLCNPNNPTGIATEKKWVLEIARRCQQLGAILVVDECFMDFLQHEQAYSVMPHLREYHNIVILKAFTKIYAMAGIRLGYLLCDDSAIIHALYAAGQPWAVSTVASKCGIAALSCTEYVQKSRALIYQNRIGLQASLAHLGCKVYDSQANFVFFRSPEPELHCKLEPYGLLLRDCSAYRNLSRGFFRAAVRLEQENNYLIECMQKILTGVTRK